MVVSRVFSTRNLDLSPIFPHHLLRPSERRSRFRESFPGRSHITTTHSQALFLLVSLLCTNVSFCMRLTYSQLLFLRCHTVFLVLIFVVLGCLVIRCVGNFFNYVQLYVCEEVFKALGTGLRSRIFCEKRSLIILSYTYIFEVNFTILKIVSWN